MLTLMNRYEVKYAFQKCLFLILSVLSLFNLVRFVNSECQSSLSDRAGMCYTRVECANLQGTAAGSCAAG